MPATKTRSAAVSSFFAAREEATTLANSLVYVGAIITAARPITRGVEIVGLEIKGCIKDSSGRTHLSFKYMGNGNWNVHNEANKTVRGFTASTVRGFTASTESLTEAVRAWSNVWTGASAA